MIEFNNLGSFKNKIIFAPNSSGKTTVSKKINENIDDYKKKLYSISTIDSLVSIDLKNIFLGTTSIIQQENNNIASKIKKSNFFKKFVNDYYRVSSAKDLKKASWMFNYLSITNIDSLDFFRIILNKNRKNKNNHIDKSRKIDESIKIDEKFNINLLKDIKNKIIIYSENKINDSIVIDEKEIDNIIPKNVINNIEKLYEYTQEFKLNYCLLCGYTDTDYKKMDEIIKNRISKYVLEDDENIFHAIISIFKKYNIDGIIKEFDTKDNSLEYKYNILLDYYIKSIKNTEKIIDYIFDNTIIESESLSDLAQVYTKNLIEINNNKIPHDKKEKYEEIVVNEISKLITLSDNMKLEFNNDILNLFISGKIENVIDVLSTSELKRLSLAVLKAEIECENINYVILDDPIDSYDDYYIQIASNYISKLIVDNKKIVWTIFTHLFDFCFILANNKVGLQLEVYYQDPDFKILSPNDFKKTIQLKKYATNYKKIKSINCNEIVILERLLSTTKNDNMFVVLSMFTTLRGLILEFNIYQKINYVESKVLKKAKNIEKSYLHYSNYIPKVKDLYDLSKKVFKNDNNNIYNSLKNDALTMRCEYVSKAFDDIKIKNLLLKIILFKMLRVQKCKYDLECKLIKLIRKNDKSSNKLDEIIATNMLKCKIEKAKEMYSFKFIYEIDRIYEKYKFLINEYSHAITRMFPPYLLSNIRDIAMFEYEIENLNEVG